MTQDLNLKNKIPFSFVSSSVDTGYAATLSSSFKSGVAIVDLHRDNYGPLENTPIQGVFTETHVGGNQHRHVPMNTGNDGPSTRPEAFNINLDTPEEIWIHSPDFNNVNHPRASMLRGNSAKAPLNIANIKTTTEHPILGNYQKDYEIIQTSGRKINNGYLKKAGTLPATINTFFVRDLESSTLPLRNITGSNSYVFVERFNAPGDPDVSSRGVLDNVAEEMAANNALPFRNTKVRNPFNDDLTQHAIQFATSSHHANRNPHRRPVSLSASLEECIEVYDNGHITHQIPQSNQQYSWITSSLSSSQECSSNSDLTFVASRLELDGTETDHYGLSETNPEDHYVSIETNQWTKNSDVSLLVNNGPYQYASWKQIRGGEHPVARLQKKENIISVQDNPKDITIETRTEKRTFRPRFSDSFKNFIEPPVSSRYKPLEHQLMLKGTTDPLSAHQINHSYGNNIGFFANKEINRKIENIKKIDPQMYDRILSFYSDKDLPEEDNPVAKFLGLYFRDTIFPRERNAYLAVNRGRTEYKEESGYGSNGYDRRHGIHRTFWRDTKENRRRTSNLALNSQNARPNQIENRSLSVFPLSTSGIKSFSYSGSYEGDNGELMLDTDASAYRQALSTPSLSYIESTNNVISEKSTDYVERLTENIAGRNPWFDTYEDFSSDIRVSSKDYSVIPEFKISEHMSYYVNEVDGNFLASNKKIFSLDGASITSSADRRSDTNYDVDFVRKYVDSDYLLNFDNIKKDHKNTAKSSKLTLRCKGLKKLLPFNGFYPITRTVQLGGLLDQSMRSHIKGYSGSVENESGIRIGLQSLLKPFVSPGILFNALKAGIAVDYPIYTGSAPAVFEKTVNQTSEFVLGTGSNYRLPFEALVNLKEYLPQNSPIRFVTAFETGSGAQLDFPYFFQWDGNKSSLYELAMHNFLAEMPNFFLADGRLNNFSSVPEFQFKEFVANKTYYMDVALQQNVSNNRFPNYIGTSSLKTNESRLDDPNGDLLRYGFFSSLSGQRLAVGHSPGFVTVSGSVFIYNNYGNNPWVLEREITASFVATPGNNTRIEGVSLYSNKLAVGRQKDTSRVIEVFASSSSGGGWFLEQEIENTNFRDAPTLSGSYLFSQVANGASAFDVVVYNSSSLGWTLEATIAKSGPQGSESTFGKGLSIDRGTLVIPEHTTGSVSDPDAGVIEIYESSSSGWTMTADFTGSASNSRLGYLYSSVSGSYAAVSEFAKTDPALGLQRINIYFSGSSWTLSDTVLVSPDSLNPSSLAFSLENGWLASCNNAESSINPATLGIYRSGSSGWALETFLNDVTGNFDLEMLGVNGLGTNITVFGDRLSVGAPRQNAGAGASFSFISESCGWSPLYSIAGTGDFSYKQDGRLFGMALPVTSDVIQLNKTLNVYDPAYLAYTPPSFYGEAIARISFTPTQTRQYSLEEIFENAEVENILSQSNDRVATFVNPIQIETSSVGYQNKMPVSASVTLFGKFSEPNIEFDLINPDRSTSETRFQANRATRSENTNKSRWTIGTKFECPILDVGIYDNAYSSSYSSHLSEVEVEYCEVENLKFQPPRTPWTNYADILPADKGVFFDIKESFPPFAYGATTGSLLKQCGFTAARKKIGRLAASKDISEAIVAIPYIDREIEGLTTQNEADCNRHFIAIDREVYRTQKENYEKLGIAVKADETPRGATSKSSTTITDMIQGMTKFIVPPQMDFLKHSEINPFVMYIFDFTTTLNSRDLIDIWHGIMPEPAIRMENDEIVISHDMNKDEFFHGQEIPDNIRWMVFKIKQRAKHNYFETTSDASDDNRFKFDFRGDGKVEVVPELNFNWPYDMFSLVELAKIEVEVQMSNTNELDKLRQSGAEESITTRKTTKRGSKKKVK